MLPQAIVVVDALPLTPNGKVDEKALPAPAVEDLVGAAHVAPRTPTERRIAAVWAAVLGLAEESVSAGASFFELGGHSLLAMRVVSRLRDELGTEVGVADLFAHPVLSALATAIDSLGQHALPPIERADRERPLVLSFAQHRLWFLDQMEGVGQTYSIPGALRLRGALDVDGAAARARPHRRPPRDPADDVPRRRRRAGAARRRPPTPASRCRSTTSATRPTPTRRRSS